MNQNNYRIISQRYICDVWCTPVSIGGLRIVCYVNFHVKYFNRVEVKNDFCGLIDLPAELLRDILKFAFIHDIILCG